MAKGTVKWFNKDKGYGFIQPEGGGSDIFVHVSQLHESGIQALTEGQAIEFEMIDGVDDRKMAGQLKLTDGDGPSGDAAADE
ncbi:MAG: cold-shock protein [Pseudomonadota bacterium]